MTISLWPLLGGALIGASAVLLMLLIGRIAGVSGIVWGAFTAANNDKLWRWMFVVGIVAGAFLFHAVSGNPYPSINDNIPLAALAGLLVGVGVKLGSGCTSGHGVCGMSRLSTRSVTATVVFMVVGIITVTLFRMLQGDNL
jgi:hypothetical protein